MGGGLHLDKQSSLLLTGSLVRECTAHSSSELHDALGGAVSGTASTVRVHETAIRSCSVRVDSASASQALPASQPAPPAVAGGGAVAIVSLSALALDASTVDACSAHNLLARERAQGGALYVLDSSASLANRTLLHDNADGAGSAALFSNEASLIDYTLPLEPGTWLPASKCEVNREPCPISPVSVQVACEATRKRCSVTPGKTNVTVEGVECQPATFNRERPSCPIRSLPQASTRTSASHPSTPRVHAQSRAPGTLSPSKSARRSTCSR